MNVPQLRFNGFDGEWKESTLKKIINSMVSGVSVNATDKPARIGKVGVLKTSSISKGRFFPLENKEILDTDIKRAKLNPIKETILISRMNTPKLVGEIGYVEQNYPELFLPDRLWMATTITSVNSKWLAYLLVTDKYNSEILNLATGTSNSMKNISKEQFFSLNIVVPSIEEQNKVVSFFALLDKKIEKQQEKIVKLEQFKKGMMQKIFSQELRFRDEDGGEFGEWEVCRLGELSDVRDGTHDTPKYVTNGYPLITSKNLSRNGNIIWNDISYISKFDYNDINKRSNVEIGDILFGMIGTIGNPVRVKISDFAIKNVALIKETGTLLNQYLIHYLKSSNIDKQFYIQQAGGTQKFIGLGLIRNLEINLPTKEEQLKISNYLDALTIKVDLESEKLIALEEQKKGFMQGMFV